MNTTEARVLKLEAQMNAMAQAWLYLASSLEMECGVDLARWSRRWGGSTGRARPSWTRRHGGR